MSNGLTIDQKQHAELTMIVKGYRSGILSFKEMRQHLEMFKLDNSFCLSDEMKEKIWIKEEQVRLDEMFFYNNIPVVRPEYPVVVYKGVG